MNHQPTFEMFRSDSDCICGLSTPPGTGGIAVVRVSGTGTADKLRALCGFLPKVLESHRIYVGTLGSANGPIDHVVVSFFAQGHSFTGQETLEISCHGGPQVYSQILEALVEIGCRMADRGEFSYRSFMNGNLDLIQAESILTLIESQSKKAAKQAYRQLKGELSKEVEQISEDLIWMLAQLEASIDFSTEDLEIVSSVTLVGLAKGLLRKVDRLIDSYRVGRNLVDGWRVGIIGRPNVGKSSLLNRVLNEPRAIVTPYAGTTRDGVEGRVQLGGYCD